MTSGGRHGPAGCRPRWENTAPEDGEVGRYEKNDAVVGPGRTDCARARVARDVESGSGAAQGCHRGRFRGRGARGVAKALEVDYVVMGQVASVSARCSLLWRSPPCSSA